MTEHTDGRSQPKERGPESGPDKGSSDRFKEFVPTSIAVDHQTSVIVLLIFLTVAGFLAYRAIPRESFPAALFKF